MAELIKIQIHLNKEITFLFFTEVSNSFSCSIQTKRKIVTQKKSSNWFVSQGFFVCFILLLKSQKNFFCIFQGLQICQLGYWKGRSGDFEDVDRQWRHGLWMPPLLFDAWYENLYQLIFFPHNDVFFSNFHCYIHKRKKKLFHKVFSISKSGMCFEFKAFFLI